MQDFAHGRNRSEMDQGKRRSIIRRLLALKCAVRQRDMAIETGGKKYPPANDLHHGHCVCGSSLFEGTRLFFGCHGKPAPKSVGSPGSPKANARHWPVQRDSSVTARFLERGGSSFLELASHQGVFAGARKRHEKVTAILKAARKR